VERTGAAQAALQAWQRATAEVTARLLSEDEPGDLLELVTRHALELSGAGLVVVALLDPEGTHLTMVSAAGAGAAAVRGLTAPLRGTLSELVISRGQVQFIEDFSTDERVRPQLRDEVALGPMAVFPLGPPGDARGVLGVAQRAGLPPLAPGAVELVTTFAAQAGIGLKLAEHAASARRLAVLADRDRIARDLHDRVIQRLFATGMALQGVLPLMTAPAGADRLRQAVDDLDETIRDIRAAIFTLQPRAEPPAVRAQIVAVTDAMTGPLGFAPSLRLDGALDQRVPAGMAQDLLAVLREALALVARRGGATQVDVTVEAGADLVAVVSDDGGGPADPPGALAGRAAELGGSLRAGQAEGGGTRLEWRVPLRAGPSPAGPPALPGLSLTWPEPYQVPRRAPAGAWPGSTRRPRPRRARRRGREDKRSSRWRPSSRSARPGTAS